jgi:hypothetical protein
MTYSEPPLAVRSFQGFWGVPAPAPVAGAGVGFDFVVVFSFFIVFPPNFTGLNPVESCHPVYFKYHLYRNYSVGLSFRVPHSLGGQRGAAETMLSF